MSGGADDSAVAVELAELTASPLHEGSEDSSSNLSTSERSDGSVTDISLSDSESGAHVPVNGSHARTPEKDGSVGGDGEGADSAGSVRLWGEGAEGAEGGAAVAKTGIPGTTFNFVNSIIGAG